MITRWQHTTAKSNYHFDPTVQEDSNPPFRVIGRVNGDLVSHLQAAIEQQKHLGYGFNNRVATQNGQVPYTDEMDRADLESLGLEPDHTYNYQYRFATDVHLKLRDAFGFKPEYYGGRFLVQKPGQMFHLHIDEAPWIRGNQKDHWTDQQPDAIARLTIMVYDWQPGHVYAYGNTYWKQWKAGDIVWHDWRNVPHATANIGRTDRATLQVTGWTTEQTLRMIREGNVTVNV
jgi:hypothetical protein